MNEVSKRHTRATPIKKQARDKNVHPKTHRRQAASAATEKRKLREYATQRFSSRAS